MIVRRGPAWWRRAIAGGTRLIVLDFAEAIAGYASYGRNRMPSLSYSGEIFELYVAPNIKEAALAAGCSKRPSAISQRTAIRLLSCGRWLETTARSASIAVSVGVLCGGRPSSSAPKPASASPSGSIEPWGARRRENRLGRASPLSTSELTREPASGVDRRKRAAEVNVVIEVPIGGEPIKYEMDKASGALKVDRFLYTSMRYPAITASSTHAVG